MAVQHALEVPALPVAVAEVCFQGASAGRAVIPVEVARTSEAVIAAAGVLPAVSAVDTQSAPAEQVLTPGTEAPSVEQAVFPDAAAVVDAPSAVGGSLPGPVWFAGAPAVFADAPQAGSVASEPVWFVPDGSSAWSGFRGCLPEPRLDGPRLHCDGNH